MIDGHDKRNNMDSSSDNSDGGVKILPPSYALKEKIGKDVDVKKIFTPEAVEKAQNAIVKQKENFLDWVVSDLEFLETQYKAALANQKSCKNEIDKIEKVSAKIKAQAGTFGFGLATLVAKSLCSFCVKNIESDNINLLVIRKHIDALLVIFNQKITGDGGSIGVELLDNLALLVEKYSVK